MYLSPRFLINRDLAVPGGKALDPARQFGIYMDIVKPCIGRKTTVKQPVSSCEKGNADEKKNQKKNTKGTVNHFHGGSLLPFINFALYLVGNGYLQSTQRTYNSLFCTDMR